MTPCDIITLSLSITELLLLSHSECYVSVTKRTKTCQTSELHCTCPPTCILYDNCLKWFENEKQTGLQFHLEVVDPMGPTSFVEKALIIHQVHCGVPCKF